MDGVEDTKRDIAYWQKRTALDQALAVVSGALDLVCAKYQEDPQKWRDEAKKALVEP